MTEQKKSVIIVGAGIGGLATAALLAKKGYRVTILEKNSTAGGRVRVLREKGFTFDMGPSWYMMPEVFDRFFLHFNKKTSDFLTLTTLKTQYKIIWDRATTLEISSSLEENLKKFYLFDSSSKEKIRKYIADSTKLYHLALNNFLYTDFSDAVSFFRIFKAVLRYPRMFGSTVAQSVSRVTSDTRLQQVLSYWSVFLGASPSNLPAVYSIMSHVDFVGGIFYPKGGMYEIIKALLRLTADHGVKILTGNEVKKFIVEDGVIKTVVTPKGSYSADIIIVNADYPFAEQTFLPPSYQSYKKEYWEKKTVAPSMFLMYLGVKGEIPSLSHHSFYLSSNWEKHFNQIFKYPSMPDDPSYYICAPTKTDLSVAPKGHENLFVLVPIAPNLKDTSAIRKAYSEKILSHLEELTGNPIRRNIVYKKIYSSSDFVKDYNAYKGTALGLTHTLLQTAFLRPSIKSKKVKNLYYVGQYTLPGTGMPMALISAEVVAKRIEKDDR